MQAKEKSNAAPTLVVKKVIRADRERVFDAWTRPDMMRHWYVGGEGTSRSTVDLRVGGKYTNEMLIRGKSCCSHSDTQEGEVKSYLHEGEYLEIRRPERLVFTWNSPYVQNTRVTVDLRAVPGGTEVTITHELPDQEACESHQQGWTFALNELEKYLA